MSVPIKADIIYYNTESDFELEFNLGGCCNMRLLSDRPKLQNDFLKSLGRAVSRSQIIFVIGQLGGENSVISDLCTAINFALVPRDLSMFGIKNETLLPESSIPLVSLGGMFGGCVIECGPQSIIVLTNERNLRHTIMHELVHEYVRDFDRNTDKTVASAPIKNKKPTPPPITEKTKSPTAYPFVLEEKPKEQPSWDRIEEEFLTETEKPKRKKFLRFLSILFFIAVGFFAYIFFAEPIVINEVYDEYRDMYGNHHALLEDGMVDDLGKLYAYNSDTVGYLSVGGTNIAYPIVKDSEKQEGYYQKHLYNGFYSYLYGTPYTVNRIEPNIYNRNILVFGKDTIKNSMFWQLNNIATLEGYRSSPILYLDTLYSKDVYKIFATIEYSQTDFEKFIRTDFADDTDFLSYVKTLRDNSTLNIAVDVAASDEIVTLVTYGRKNGVVIVARKVRIGEDNLVDTQSAKENFGGGYNIESKPIEENQKPTAYDEAVPFANYSQNYEQGAPLDSNLAAQYAELFAQIDIPEGVDVGDQIISVTNALDGQIVTGAVRDILCRIVEAEMGADFEAEALKAQAVASYGWLITNGAFSNNAPTVALETAKLETTTAVNEVIGQIPYINDKIAQTLYFDCSAGYTADCGSTFKTELNYGTADSSFDKNSENFVTYRIYSADNIKKWVLECTGTDLSLIADKSNWFNLSLDKNNIYVTHVWFGNSGTLYSGRFVREKLLNYQSTQGNTLPSTAFKVSYRPQSDSFVFEVRGSGHGVGMSQFGANELAKRGFTYTEILEHYYGNIIIK